MPLAKSTTGMVQLVKGGGGAWGGGGPLAAVVAIWAAVGAAAI